MFGQLIHPDFQAAAEAWKETNQSRYVHTQIPWVLTSGPRSGWGRDTAYRIPAFGTWLGEGGLGVDYEPGDELPGLDVLDDVPVTLSTRGKASHGIPVPVSPDGSPNRLADADNVVPGLMSVMWGIRERLLAVNLTDPSIRGSAKSFSGTDPLLQPDSDGSRSIIGDIDEAVDPLNSIRMMNLDLWCFTNRRMVDILRRQPDYHGAGANGSGGGSGAGSPGKVAGNRSRFLDFFATQHDLDNILMFDIPVNRAARGATRNNGSIQTLAGTDAFLSFVLVDTRSMFRDMTGGTPSPRVAPDGGLVGVKEVMEPFITDETSRNKETTIYYGKDGVGYAAPRSGAAAEGNTFSCFFTGNILS